MARKGYCLPCRFERSTLEAMEAYTSSDQGVLRARLDALPENIKGEVIGDTLYTMPRPRMRHMRASSFIVHHIGGKFDFDDDGHGGWWIVVEPGIEFPGASEVSPDVAGWRRSTMPEYPPIDEPIRTVPDWVCEVLSPSSSKYDQGVKREFYSKVGVSWFWIVDPLNRYVIVRELVDGSWVIRAVVGDEEKVRLPPFEETEIPINRMWAP